MIFGPRKEPFRLTLGERGEMMAWGFLAKQGYTFLEKNYRCAIGEIDAIAKKDSRLRFIEIKTRTSHDFGAPEEAVHSVKQKKIQKLAAWYLKEKKQADVSVSFDVVAITWPGAGEPRIRLIENAFTADEAKFTRELGLFESKKSGYYSLRSFR